MNYKYWNKLIMCHKDNLDLPNFDGLYESASRDHCSGRSKTNIKQKLYMYTCEIRKPYNSVMILSFHIKRKDTETTCTMNEIG